MKSKKHNYLLAATAAAVAVTGVSVADISAATNHAQSIINNSTLTQYDLAGRDMVFESSLSSQYSGATVILYNEKEEEIGQSTVQENGKIVITLTDSIYEKNKVTVQFVSKDQSKSEATFTVNNITLDLPKEDEEEYDDKDNREDLEITGDENTPVEWAEDEEDREETGENGEETNVTEKPSTEEGQHKPSPEGEQGKPQPTENDKGENEVKPGETQPDVEVPPATDTNEPTQDTNEAEADNKPTTTTPTNPIVTKPVEKQETDAGVLAEFVEEKAKFRFVQKNKYVFEVTSKHASFVTNNSVLNVYDTNGSLIGAARFNELGTVQVILYKAFKKSDVLTIQISNKTGEAEYELPLKDYVEEEEIVPPTQSNDTSTPPTTNTPVEVEQLQLTTSTGAKVKISSIITQLTQRADQLEVTLIDGETNQEIDMLRDRVTVEIDTNKNKLTIDGAEINSPFTLPNKTNITDLRVMRVDESDKKLKAVPHYMNNERLVISTNNLKDLAITSSPSVPFTDIEKVFSKDEIEQLYVLGIVNGTTGTTYSPSSQLTRAQFSSMIARALELKPTATTLQFADVKGKWYANDVQALYEAGLITGYSADKFGGGDPLTRQQAAAMLTRMLDYLNVDTKPKKAVSLTDAHVISEYARNAVFFLANSNVVNSGNTVAFNPKDNITRAQMAKMLMRTLEISDIY